MNSNKHKGKGQKGEFSANELVTLARIKKIERDHKSIGAVLDNRELHCLDDVRTREEHVQKQEAETRLQNRRGGKVGNAMKAQSAEAVDLLVEKGIKVVNAHTNFENEEMIWKTKSSSLAYSQKRRFYHPELQTLLDGFTLDQRKDFRIKSREALFAVSQKLRDEVNDMKRDMNGSGIFHPEANNHRAHCLYLIKLYKAITSASIEDPVLMKMRAEMVSKNEAILAESQRMETALCNAHQAAPPVGGILNAVAAKNTAASLTTNNLAMPNTGKILSPLSEKSNDKKKKLGRIQTSKSAANMRSNNPGSKAGSFGFVSNTPSTQSHGGQSLGQPMNALDSNGPGSPAPNATTALTLNDKRLFAKMKKNRLATVDPRKFLLDESAKLEAGETAEFTKEKPRSQLLVEKTSEWVIDSLQQDCIFSAAGGNAFPNKSWRDVPGLHQESTMRTGKNSLLGEHEDAHVPVHHHVHKHHHHNQTPATPAAATAGEIVGFIGDGVEEQKIVSFETFQEMFKSYSSDALQAHLQEKDDDAAAAAGAMEGGGEGKKSTTEEVGCSSTKKKGLKASAHVSQTSASRPRPMETDGITSSSKADIFIMGTKDTVLGDASPMTGDDCPGKSTGSSHHMMSTGAPKLATSASAPLPNLVNVVADTDPQFNMYLMRSLRELPAGKMITKTTTSLTAPKKVRKIAPLGKNAVSFKRSSGKKSGPGVSSNSSTSSAGFNNAFKDMAIEDSDIEDTTMGQDDDGDSSESSVFTDDEELNTPTDRITSKKSGRQNKSRNRLSHRDEANAATASSPIQQKLLAIFTCLQMSCLTRINFMHKYSSSLFARELEIAINLWSAVAVYAVARLETSKLIRKLQHGYCMMPLHYFSLVNQIQAELPAILTNPMFEFHSAATSAHFAAEGLENDQYTAQPLSFQALSYCGDLIKKTFNARGDEGEGDDEVGGLGDDLDQGNRSPLGFDEDEDEDEVLIGASTEKEAFGMLCWVARELEKKIQTGLKKASDELDDVIPFGGASCREWLSSAAIKLPKKL